jgi:molybdenum cofactor cytidylyltransferase
MGKAGGVSALILAAGYSSRAPGFKPLLPLGDCSVIETTIKNFRQAGIDAITAVAGYQAAKLLPVLSGLDVKPVFNANFDQGMFSSVLAGIKSLGPEAEAFFLLPADMPLVRSHTIRLLARAYQKTRADVIYPVFQGQRGHPPLISANLLPAILAWNRPEGLRLLLEQHEDNAYELEVLDEGVLLDIDTAADYREVIGCYGCRHIPTLNECEAILTKLKVPDMVVRHSRLVADVAWKLADRLNQAGIRIDSGLVVAAGLLHDLAKGKPDHACFGAKVLRGLGFPKVAEIVASHTDIAISEIPLLNETALVYLADKLVMYDHVVTIDERFRCSIEKFAGDADVLAAISKRQANAQTIIRQIEAILGQEFAKVIVTETPMLAVVAER